MTRLFDILASLLGLLVLWPIMILVAIAVKWDSKGPVIFKQKRLTKNMREFYIYKFRSMVTHFDKDAIGIKTKVGADSITKVGHIIRKLKLDELPQLINILKGDMAVIGPRALVPKRGLAYTENEKETFTVICGLSSPASIVLMHEGYLLKQVNDLEKFDLEQIHPFKIKLNHYYIQHKSFRYDLWLTLATILSLLNLIRNETIIKDEELIHEYHELGKAAKRY